jgi:hypothetical protein
MNGHEWHEVKRESCSASPQREARETGNAPENTPLFLASRCGLADFQLNFMAF